MGTYGRVRREKRASLGNDSEPRGAPWTHKIVTICVTLLRARWPSWVRETRSWRYLRDARDVPFMGRKMRHGRPYRHHAWPHSASGEPSGMTEQAVPGRIGHREEICAIVMMWHFVTFWHFLLDRFLRYVMDIMFRRCINSWFSACIKV